MSSEVLNYLNGTYFPVDYVSDAKDDYRQLDDYESLQTLHLNFSGSAPYGMGENFSVALNQVLSDFRSSLYLYKRWQQVLVIICYISLFLVSVCFNFLVLVTVFRYRRLQSITNYFLVNLSIADLLVTLICMPMAIATNIYRPWIYGVVTCKMVPYMEGVAVSASIFTLTTVSIDRFVAIRYSMKFRQCFNRSRAIKAIVGIWSVSICLFVPVLLVRTTEGIHLPQTGDNFVFCIEKWPRHSDRLLYSGILFLLMYVIPGNAIVLAYTMISCSLMGKEAVTERLTICRHPPNKVLRSRRRIARIMLLLAFIFAVCWLPYNITTLVLDTSEDTWLQRKMSALLPFALVLGHSNSAVNPVLYCLLAKTFRKCVWDALCRWLKKLKLARKLPKLRKRQSAKESIKMCRIHTFSKSPSLQESSSNMLSSCSCQRSNSQKSVSFYFNSSQSVGSSLNFTTKCCHFMRSRGKNKMAEVGADDQTK